MLCCRACYSFHPSFFSHFQHCHHPGCVSNQPFQTDFTSVLSFTPPTFHIYGTGGRRRMCLEALFMSVALCWWCCWTALVYFQASKCLSVPVWLICCGGAAVTHRTCPLEMKTWIIKLRWRRFHCHKKCGITKVFLKSSLYARHKHKSQT